jgi:hypothetical protein
MIEFEPFGKSSIIVVPSVVFDPTTYLSKFCEKNHENIRRFEDGITDENFAGSASNMNPGDRFRVQPFQQVGSGNNSSEERMAFLSARGAVYLGPIGLCLAFRQKHYELPKDKWLSSYNAGEELWKNTTDRQRVSAILSIGDDFFFELHRFELPKNEDYAFLGFFREPTAH